MANVMIENGLVFDGTGAEPFVGDVHIEGERIVSVSPGAGPDGKERPEGAAVIDASGLAVTPGFIDIHSHSDHTILVDPRTFSPLKQGVTLEVVGNCGFGCFPVVDPELARSRIYAYHDVTPISWRSAGEYFAAVDAGKPGINVISLVPNGQLRLAVVGPSDEPATAEQQREMRKLLDESLEAGAWGLSTCLESGEEISMSEEEVTELLRRVAKYGGIHACHTRDRAARAAEAIDEAIRTATAAGARLQVSHLIPDGGMEDLQRCVEVVDRAAEQGADVNFDMHTRLFGIGYLYTAVPPAWLQGAADEVAARLRDPALRRELQSYRSGMSAWGRWDRILLLDNEVWPQYSRKSIAEIADERGTAPLDTVCDLLAETADDVSRLWMIELTFTEDQQRSTFVHPLCVPMSDAAALALDGPLANSEFHGAYGWASWFYRNMVRDSRLMSPHAAIHKLTGQPASILDLKGRGTLVPGNYADIAVFDADEFSDRETMFTPNVAAVGMRHVLVNGELALSDGEPTGQRSGRVLRREA
jgi:N-acyl-D-amino-acid deacylase